MTLECISLNPLYDLVKKLIISMSDLFLDPVSAFNTSDVPENMPFWVSHTMHWAKIIENSFPQIKAYFAADKKIFNSETSFLPVYRIKRPFNRICWLSIPYTSICDPVLNGGASIEMFMKFLNTHSLTQKCKIELRTSTPLQETYGYSVHSDYLTHFLHLDGNENEVFKRFHRTAVQAHIRKSLESGINLRLGSSLKDVEDFYHIYIQMRKEICLPPQPFLFFKNMWTELNPHNHIELLLAEYNRKVIAGMWVLKNRWFYSFEYLARAGKNDRFRCTHFLYWQGIRRAIESKIPIVSFCRTSARNTGLDLFKRRWGTDVVPCYDLIYPDSEVKPREENTLFKIMQKISPALPLPLFRLLGEIIYRHI